MIPARTCSRSKVEATSSKPDESARLASQVYLQEGTVKTGFPEQPSEANPDQQRQLKKFISGADTPPEKPRNPFARIVEDALVAKKQKRLDPDVDTWLLEPVLVLTSTRRKFVFHLAGGPQIEFSADVATGTLADEKQLDQLGIKWAKPTASVCSFEFGVGHPGVTGASAGGTSQTTNASAKPMTLAEKASFFGTQGGGFKGGTQPASKSSAVTPTSTTSTPQLNEPGKFVFGRPYHVPADVDNPELVHTADYEKFVQVRDRLMKLIQSGIQGLELAPGGSKASLLAREMGLVPKT